ncbi:MAG: hypothetical protein P0120_17115 [Nitrospira sp.]|nr:hypothetical protein [Nitrospira sp.]
MSGVKIEKVFRETFLDRGMLQLESGRDKVVDDGPWHAKPRRSAPRARPDKARPRRPPSLVDKRGQNERYLQSPGPDFLLGGQDNDLLETPDGVTA